MTKRLELLFTNESGRSVTLSLDDPIEPVDNLLVSAVMDEIIDHNVFTTFDGALVQKRGARIVERTVQDIEL
ncbi:DUF2922 domain-containing protein [Evansella sp. AB-P1]|uniref:DUF2922 domain-containing protein n=1 Tax=Evansella sp. AB-P1 TaxID=3037653 RepID=UPI00241D8185|nr:DUF2922 domain-containing protein [Evansella sp. AB-P1]MDG5789216.1 DUF2922 domain-containing protein [Evansella sp. AB-P1]